MRNTDKRRDILDLKIGKSVKYTAAAFSGAFMHLTFLVVFAIIQLYVMVIFNVFSVGLYIVLGMICKRENFERRAYNWISAIYFEIALHSFFCTLFLGVNTCFFLYTMMTIPVMLYYLFLTCEKKDVQARDAALLALLAGVPGRGAGVRPLLRPVLLHVPQTPHP